MAETFNTAAAITRDEVNKGVLVDSVATHNAILWTLRRNGSIRIMEGGNPWKTTVRLFGTNNVTPADRFEVVSTAYPDFARQASYTPTTYLCAVPLAKEDLQDNQGSLYKIVDLMMSAVETARISFETTIDQDLFSTGSDTKRIAGIASAIRTDTATATVGGLAGTTYSRWRCNVTDTFGDFAANYESKMLTAYLAVTVGNDKPNLLVSRSNIWIAYHNSLTPAVRYEDVDMANHGFDNITYRRKPWVWDDNAVSGELDMLNTKYISWYIHRSANFTLGEFQDADHHGQYAKVALMALRSQLIWTNLNRQAYLGGITV